MFNLYFMLYIHVSILHVNATCQFSCCILMSKLHCMSMPPCCMPLSMLYVHAACPRCISMLYLYCKSVLYVSVHAGVNVYVACPLPRCISMLYFMLHIHVSIHVKMLHVHVHATCPIVHVDNACLCRYCLSMSTCIYISILLAHFHAACSCVSPCCMSMLDVQAACPCCISMPHVMLYLHVDVHDAYHAACQCCLSMLYVHATCPCLYSTCPSYMYNLRNKKACDPPPCEYYSNVPFTPRFLSKNTHDHCHISKKKFEPKFCLELA
jgi:hypothetical protein